MPDDGPALPASLDALARWVDDHDDQALCDHAWRLVERRCRAVGLTLSLSEHARRTQGLGGWAWYASHTLRRFPASEPRDEMLRGVFADLADLVATAPGSEETGCLVRRQCSWLGEFASYGVLSGETKALLPPRVYAVLPEIERVLGERADREREEQAFRDGQMGY